MRDVIDHLSKWWEAGDAVALATVVQTFQSSPREAGASMIVGDDGRVYGSVSGGCVEGAVYALAEGVLSDARPILKRYGVSDDLALEAGLTCGGILDVFVERLDRQTFPELGEVFADVADGRPVAIATVIEHPDPGVVGRRLVIRPEGEPQGSLGAGRLGAAVMDDVRGLLAAGHSQTLTYGPLSERRGEGLRVFASIFCPPPRMLVFGAIDFAAAVANIAAFSDTASPCAMRVLSSRLRHDSRRRMKSSPSGRTSIWPPRTWPAELMIELCWPY